MSIVTIGIPFYNAEKTLVDAVRSVFAQTLTEWELILVDDGSTDHSLDIANSIEDSRVRVISDGKQLGLAARLNQIALIAKSRYLARMDADDMMHPDRLKVQADFLDQNPDIDVVGTGMVILNKDLVPVAKRDLSKIELTPRRIFSGYCLMHATVMGKTNWFIRNPYNLFYSRSQDYELWCRTIKNSKFAVLSHCYYYVNEYGSFSLKKYFDSTKFDILTQWKYGPKEVGFFGSCALSGKRIAKLFIYAIAVALGVQNKIIFLRKGNITLSEPEIEEIRTNIAKIKRTYIPLRQVK